MSVKTVYKMFFVRVQRLLYMIDYTFTWQRQHWCTQRFHSRIKQSYFQNIICIQSEFDR